MNSLIRLISLSLLAIALGAAPALAAGSDSSESSDSGSGWSNSKSSNPDYAAARQHVEAERFEDAVPLLQKVVAKEPENADAYNYLGFSLRKQEKFDEAMAAYQKALAIEPEHRGANEYLGELYLQLGDLPKAEERLEVLDGACFFGCSEYRELKEAIASYKAKQSS
ncbi:MAG: tetratricopeptide repeat protein [Kiloniellales bacterium]